MHILFRYTKWITSTHLICLTKWNKKSNSFKIQTFFRLYYLFSHLVPPPMQYLKPWHKVIHYTLGFFKTKKKNTKKRGKKYKKRKNKKNIDSLKSIHLQKFNILNTIKKKEFRFINPKHFVDKNWFVLKYYVQYQMRHNFKKDENHLTTTKICPKFYWRYIWFSEIH